MSGTKIILVIVLLSLAFHLFLYGYMKRRIAAAKRKAEPDSSNDDGHIPPG